MCDLTNLLQIHVNNFALTDNASSKVSFVVQMYVNNFTVTDDASSKGSFVSALNSKGPLSSSSRRTNWAQISTRKICQC